MKTLETRIEHKIALRERAKARIASLPVDCPHKFGCECWRDRYLLHWAAVGNHLTETMTEQLEKLLEREAR